MHTHIQLYLPYIIVAQTKNKHKHITLFAAQYSTTQYEN